MAYSQDVYSKAQSILQSRREQAVLQQERRKAECFTAHPRLEALQWELNQVGLQISKAFLQGGDRKTAIDSLSSQSLRLQEEKNKILSQAGLPKDYLSVQYACGICKDTGVDQGRLCVCQKMILKEIERENLRKIAPLDRAAFDNFKLDCYSCDKQANGMSPRQLAESVYTGCVRYAAQFSRKSPSLLFIGATGLGKTHLSLAIANSVIEKGYSVIYGSSNAVFTDMEAARFNRETRPGAYYEQDILNCDLFILDDLGAEFITQFSVSCLYNLVNARLLSGRPTIVSTNFSTLDLEQRYDQRITSRLTNEYTVLRLMGEDIRRINKK